MYADTFMTRQQAIRITVSSPGTKWEDVPDDFLCPLCGVGKDQFSEVE